MHRMKQKRHHATHCLYCASTIKSKIIVFDFTGRCLYSIHNKTMYYSDIPDIALSTAKNSPLHYDLHYHTCDSLCNSAQDKLNHKLHL